MTATIERTNDNSIINALKRLERAGSGESKATTKLIEASKEVGDYICEIVRRANMVGVKLPRDYHVEEDEDNCARCGWSASKIGLLKGAETKIYREVVMNSSGVARANSRCYYCTQSYPLRSVGWLATCRDEAQVFASDLADGLLDEIAAFLEQRIEESQQALGSIQAAQAKMSVLV